MKNQFLLLLEQLGPVQGTAQSQGAARVSYRQKPKVLHNASTQGSTPESQDILLTELYQEY